MLKALAQERSLIVLHLRAEAALDTPCSAGERAALTAILGMNDIDKIRLLIAETTGDAETASELRRWLVKKAKRQARKR